MLNVKLTAGQRKDIRDGKPTQVTTKEGVTVLVTPWLVEYAKQVLASGGGVIDILPAVVGGNRMEPVRVEI